VALLLISTKFMLNKFVAFFFLYTLEYTQIKPLYQMATCYIIDDDIHAIEATAKYIVKTPNLTLLGSNTNPLVALEQIRSSQQKLDIVFLDVEMPELSGIDLADLLDPSIAVVFTTSHSKYALQAFQKDAFDFLLKPFSFEMFLKAIEKVRSRIQNVEPKNSNNDIEKIFINIGTKGKIVQLVISEILYIEALDHVACIYTQSEKYMSRVSIKTIESQLPTTIFIRTHRSFLVNIDLIKSIEGNMATMSNGISIPFGELYRRRFMDKIKSRIINGKNAQP
jgi:two-component system LytT family response regulator